MRCRSLRSAGRTRRRYSGGWRRCWAGGRCLLEFAVLDDGWPGWCSTPLLGLERGGGAAGQAGREGRGVASGQQRAAGRQRLPVQHGALHVARLWKHLHRRAQRPPPPTPTARPPPLQAGTREQEARPGGAAAAPARGGRPCRGRRDRPPAALQGRWQADEVHRCVLLGVGVSGA